MIVINQMNMIRRMSVLEEDLLNMYLHLINPHRFVIVVLVDRNTVHRHRLVHPQVKKPHLIIEIECHLDIVASEDGSDDGESYDPVYSSNNRTESSVFYGTRGGSYLPTEIDPFQKSVNPHNSYYIKRQDSHR